MNRRTLEEAITRAEQAIEAGLDHAGVSWSFAALLAVRYVAERNDEFISDMVWDTGLPAAPTDSRALGGVMRSAASEGWIKSTSETRKGRGLNRNATDVRVWRSLLT